MKTAQERFWAKVDKSGECWLWTGKLDKNGYGLVQIENRAYRAHRIAYQFVRGHIPDGIFGLHCCDNRACVNPWHIFLGSRGDNARDMVAKGRGQRQFKKGELRGENHPNAKLTWSQVHEMRTRYAAGGVTKRQLSVEYGVREWSIYQIIGNKHWKE